MLSVEAIDALYDRGGSPDNAISHYEVYMKESKEDKTVQLMESAVIALENIASVLTQISYHLGADLNKTVLPVSDKISYPAPEIEVNTADAKSEPANTEPANTEPAKAEEGSAQEPAKEEPETVLTLEDLRQACIQASQHNNEAKNAIRSILTGKYGVKNISGLDVKDYYAFWKEIQSL